MLLSRTLFALSRKLCSKATLALHPESRLLNSFTVQNIQDFNDKVTNSKLPVIVDFFASWCSPCKTLQPRLESVIAEKNGKILLAKVDVDENTDLAMDYEVGVVPVLLAFKDGEVKERLEGLKDTEELRKFIESICNMKAEL